MLEAKYVRPNEGYDYDQELCREKLKLNESYEVNSVNMGQSHTYISLEGVEGYFNSVNFDFYEDNEPIDIYRDSRYNPYLRRIV